MYDLYFIVSCVSRTFYIFLWWTSWRKTFMLLLDFQILNWKWLCDEREVKLQFYSPPLFEFTHLLWILINCFLLCRRMYICSSKVDHTDCSLPFLLWTFFDSLFPSSKIFEWIPSHQGEPLELTVGILF